MTHQTPETQHRSEALLKTLVELLPVGIALFDASGNCRFINPCWQTLTGILLPDNAETHWLNAIHTGDRPSVTQAWHRLIEAHEAFKLELRLPVTAQTTRRVYAIGSPLSPPDSNVLEFAFVCVLMDATEQWELRQRIRHTEKLDAIGALAGGIAHDFNNQLSGILGYADAFKRITDDEKVLKFADKITNASQRASELTKKLLTFSRKGQFKQEEVNVHRLIEEAADILFHTIDKRIEIVMDLQARYHTLLGDASQLLTAILNIGLNARDAMQDGGTLSISTSVDNKRPAVYQQSQQAGTFEQYLVMTIRDTGCGMPEEVMEHIFEPFYTTKTEGKGTGMGLASVYGIIKHHGGAVTVDSTMGAGTTFNIYLPVVAIEMPSREQAAKPVSQTPEERPLRILLADDEDMVREMAQEILLSAGHEVMLACDGADATEQYAQHWQSLDLVILDMIMPKLDGLGAFNAMRSINPSLRCILVSGFGDESRMQKLIEDGIIAIVKKPFRVAELLSAVETAAAGA